MMWLLGFLVLLAVGVPTLAVCIVASGDVRHEDDVWDFDL